MNTDSQEDKYCATIDCVKYYKETLDDVCPACGQETKDLPQDPSLPKPEIV